MISRIRKIINHYRAKRFNKKGVKSFYRDCGPEYKKHYGPDKIKKSISEGMLPKMPQDKFKEIVESELDYASKMLESN